MNGRCWGADVPPTWTVRESYPFLYRLRATFWSAQLCEQLWVGGTLVALGCAMPRTPTRFSDAGGASLQVYMLHMVLCPLLHPCMQPRRRKPATRMRTRTRTRAGSGSASDDACGRSRLADPAAYVLLDVVQQAAGGGGALAWLAALIRDAAVTGWMVGVLLLLSGQLLPRSTWLADTLSACRKRVRAYHRLFVYLAIAATLAWAAMHDPSKPMVAPTMGPPGGTPPGGRPPKGRVPPPSWRTPGWQKPGVAATFPTSTLPRLPAKYTEIFHAGIARRAARAGERAATVAPAMLCCPRLMVSMSPGWMGGVYEMEPRLHLGRPAWRKRDGRTGFLFFQARWNGFVIAERRGAKAAYAKAPRLVCPHVSSWLWYSASQNKWMVEGIHPVRVQCVADGAKPMGAAAAGAMATPARSVGFARGGAPSFSGKSKVGMGASMGVPPLEKVHAPAAQMEKVKMPALPLEKVEVTALEESTPPFMGQGPTAGAAPPSEVDAQQPSAGNAMGYERWNGGGAPGMKWARKKRRKWRNAAKEEKLEGVKEKDEG